MTEDRHAAEISSFLEEWPTPIAVMCGQLRHVMGQAFPELEERLRPGWRLIGYNLLIGRKRIYLAWIWPQVEHVHIGWQQGTLMRDPRGLLHGYEENLKKVRYLTYPPGRRVAASPITEFTREAIRIASMSRGERELLEQMRAHPSTSSGG